MTHVLSFATSILDITLSCNLSEVSFNKPAVSKQTNKQTKTLLIVPTDAQYYKIIEMLKQYKNYNIFSDMFRFAQEPSSGSSPVLR